MKKIPLRVKRVLALFLAAALLMTGCGGIDRGSKAEQNEGYKIAIVPKNISSGWFQRMQVGVDAYNEEHGTDYYFGGPTDAADQIMYIEQLLAEKWDAICVVPFDTDSIEPVLRKARDEGILVITHEADSLDPRYYDYDLEAFEPEDLGAHYGEELVRMTGGEGVYVQFVGSLNSVSHMRWCDGAEAYISQNSSLKNLGRYETGDDLLTAYNLTKELLLAHPEIIAFDCSAATDIAGVGRALEELGLAGKISFIGTSLVSISGEYLKRGTVESFSLWDPADSGRAMLELAEKILSEGDAFDPATCSLKTPGYETMSLLGRVFYGTARRDVTLENMDDFDF